MSQGLPEDRVGVRKRLTRKTGDGYESAEYSVERSRPSGVTISDALVDIETVVDVALDRFRRESTRQIQNPSASTGPSSQPSPQPRAAASELTIPQEGWTSFQSGKGAWIKSEAAPQLRDALSRADGKTLVAGAYRYKLSGDTGQFINRFTHNGGSSK